jgi:hypothetical protein
MGAKDLRRLFCERFGCAESEYAERALEMCLYPQAKFLAPLLRKVSPNFFSGDLQFLDYLGNTPNMREAQVEISNFSQGNQMRGSFLRERLRLRVSGRRAARLAAHTFRTVEGLPAEHAEKAEGEKLKR